MKSYNGFNLNDRVKVTIDWAPETKNKRAQIIGFQVNGGLVFAKLLWLGPTTKDFDKLYGVLFETKDLVKVEK
jgi:hypothetical protein